MGGLPKSPCVFLSFSWRDDARSGFTQNSKPFIIEAGAGELDHNLGWRSFFRLVSNDRASVESEVTFLKVNFKCPEEAIRAALAEARVRLRPERVNHVWSCDLAHGRMMAAAYGCST